MIRAQGGVVHTTWETAVQALYSGLKASQPVAGILSGRNTNEEAFLFAKLVKKLAADYALEVFYQARELTQVQKILMSPDRAPNFRGARALGVSTNGGLAALTQKLTRGSLRADSWLGRGL